jgi:hypothetical protein
MSTRFPRRFTAAALAATTAVSIGVSATAAHAATGNIVDYGSQAHWITATYDGMNVAVANAAGWAGAPVIQWYNDGGTEQKWYFDYVLDAEGGFQGYEVRNENSGMCLYNDEVAGDTMVQEPCDPNNSGELFWITSGHIYAHFGPLLYVDVSGVSYGAGANIDGWYQNGGINQNFSIYNVSS